MLSNMDLIKRLAKGDIGIAPFESQYIEDANICVTASKYAWSIGVNDKGKRDCLFKNPNGGIGHIEIPGRQSALVFSQEAIYIGEKLAGLCLPKVAMALKKGLLCTGGPMKPKRAEHLVIIMHNQSDEAVTIDVGEKIAVLMFFELATKYESTATEKELNDTINDFLKGCSDDSMLTELKELRKKYKSGNSIISEMKDGNNKEDFKMFIKENDLKAQLKRNIPFSISILLFLLQIIGLIFVGNNQPYLTWLVTTIGVTAMFVIAFLSKKIK
jgi:dUTPase